MADLNRPHRDRGAAARAILALEAREQRERRRSTADEQWQEIREAGWWSHWHCGYGPDSDCEPGDPLYGRNLLHSDDPPRDPMGPRFTVKHPPKSEWIEAQFRKFEAKSGEKLERTPRTDLLLGVDDDE